MGLAAAGAALGQSLFGQVRILKIVQMFEDSGAVASMIESHTAIVRSSASTSARYPFLHSSQTMRTHRANALATSTSVK
jgi:hypothetical protein